MTAYNNRSPSYNITVNSVEADEFPLVALEITHDDLDPPARIINDQENLTIEGNVYTGVPFEITLPTQMESGTPSAQIAINNIGETFTNFIESSDGAYGTKCRIIQIRRSIPSIIEFEQTMNFENVHIDTYKVSADLTYEDVLNRKGISYRYDTKRAIGLF